MTQVAKTLLTLHCGASIKSTLPDPPLLILESSTLLTGLSDTTLKGRSNATTLLLTDAKCCCCQQSSDGYQGQSQSQLYVAPGVVRVSLQDMSQLWVDRHMIKRPTLPSRHARHTCQSAAAMLPAHRCSIEPMAFRQQRLTPRGAGNKSRGNRYGQPGECMARSNTSIPSKRLPFSTHKQGPALMTPQLRWILSTLNSSHQWPTCEATTQTTRILISILKTGEAAGTQGDN